MSGGSVVWDETRLVGCLVGDVCKQLKGQRCFGRSGAMLGKDTFFVFRVS